MVPVLALIAGVLGSLHCVGMCGGLVYSVSTTSKSVVTYQFGRLISYIILGAIGGFFGSFLKIDSINNWIAILPSFFIGLLLIIWGVKSFNGAGLNIKLPKFFTKYTVNIWGKLVSNKSLNQTQKSFLMGLMSILLPCGLLYSVIFAVASFESIFLGITSLVSFWLGTVPALVIAPDLLRRVLLPLQSKRPLIISSFAIILGFITLGYRAIPFLFEKVAPLCH
jgi:sulfite exporter TauE/SafE